MLLDGVLMQYQSDPAYSGEIMCSPAWQRYSSGKNKGKLDPDYVIEFFCRNVMALNMFNLFNKGKKYLNIKELNDLIIKYHGYYYLNYLNKNNYDVEKTRLEMEDKKLIGKESYVNIGILNWILGIEKDVKEYKGIIDIESKQDFFGIKTKFNDTGHYSMIIKPDLTYLDSFDCKIKKPKKEDVKDIIKLTFKKNLI